MKDLIFLTENYSSSEYPKEKYLVTYKSNFETLRLSESPAGPNEGKDTYQTGDTIMFKTNKSLEVAEKIFKEKEMPFTCAIRDFIDGREHGEIFDYVETTFENTDDLKEGVDYELGYVTVKGFNYYDGSNWNRIIVERDDDIEPEYDIVDDEKLIKKLKKVIMKCKLIENLSGVQTYKHKKFILEVSQYSSAWELYTIYRQ